MMFSKLLQFSLFAAGSMVVSGLQALTECKPGYVALTYDDGPYEYTEALSELLRSENVKATFFVNGENFWSLDSVPSAQAAIKRAYRDGHQIASHTWSHQDLTDISGSQFDSEISKLENKVYSLIRKRMAFIRPPYGAYDDNVLKKLNSKGYKVVNWSTDTKDYETHNIESEMDNIRASYSSSNRNKGFIILAHDVYQQTTVELTKAIIRYTKEQNFKFATVAECFGASPYR